MIARRIGDVLLATPVIRSLKRAWAETAFDVLVFEGTQDIVTSNPDVRHVLTVPQRPTLSEHAGLYWKLFRRYDLALSLQSGDRPTLYAFAAGRRRVGLLLPDRKNAWKRHLLHQWVPFDDLDTHTVRMNLALVEALGVVPRPEVVVSWSPDDESRVAAVLAGKSDRPLAVLHPYPKFNYKLWHRAGWAEVARWLDVRGYRIALTGGPDPAEVSYTAEIAADMPAGTLNLVGQLSLGGAGCLLSQASLYLGPDTALTHMAAALGIPVAALYGPTNPVKWGPWPRNHAPDINPWRRCGTQQVGNVVLVQGSGACVPCHLEGCERHVLSYSDCLQTLAARTVIKAVEAALGGGRSAT